MTGSGAVLSTKPARLALFGRPVHHSLSPLIHQDFARQCGLQVDYALKTCADSEFDGALADFFSTGGLGANITLPFKGQAADCVQQLSPDAAKSGVVNTITVAANGQLAGHNTDGAGFVRDLLHRRNFSIHNRTIVVIGAGGAAQGIIPALQTENPARLLVANRSQKRLDALLRRFSGIETVPLASLPDLPVADLVINATSLGHKGQSVSVEKNLFGAETVAYDLSYSAAAQPFVRACQKAGAAAVYDGLGMLVEQAALAFSLWFGKPVSTEGVYRRLAGHRS